MNIIVFRRWGVLQDRWIFINCVGKVNLPMIKVIQSLMIRVFRAIQLNYLYVFLRVLIPNSICSERTNLKRAAPRSYVSPDL